MASNYYQKNIFINNKPLVLTNMAERYISKNVHAAGYLLLSGAFTRNVRLAIKHLESVGGRGAIIHDISIEALEEMLKEEFTEITAAGGLVTNNEGKLLMIYRRGYWDLPKGKMDAGESSDECAVREVKEETGIEQLSNTGKLCTTYHYYEEHQQRILKRTDWYSMHSEYTNSLQPQMDEGIIAARWVDKQEAPLLIKQTYSIIKELVNDYFLKK